MTKQEMLAEVEAKIRKDIPRLMELKEGCILMKRDTKYNPVYIKIVFTYNNTYYIPSQCFGLKVIEFSKENIDKDYEIIGHDIMLNDVLEWLNIKNKNITIYSDGTLFELNKAIFYKKIGIGDYGIIKWDLSKLLLKDQSEELIKLLYNLIKE